MRIQDVSRSVRFSVASLLAAIALGGLPACTTTPAPPASPAAESTRGPVIYVMIDGFRNDYIDRGITPALSALAANGVRTQGMRPSTPSVSSPNHYTLVTGLLPDHHGMVDNTFFDAGLGMFGVNQAANRNPKFWEGGTPIWITAQRQGVRTGVVNWGGSDVPIQGTTATYFAQRQPSLTNPQRVDQLLAWLDLPESERPGLYLLYFSSVDTAGHLNGPDSPKTNEAIAEADAAIARLMAGLEARGVDSSANIVVVADHGMTPISTVERLIPLDKLVDVNAVQDTSYGATLGVNPKPGREAEVEKALLGKRDHLECWRKAELPARLRYGNHPRVPAIFCLVEPGWTVGTPLAASRFPVNFFGNHGFDPELPDMAAVFIARGPAFKRGVTIPVFDNIHVYPLVLHVLGIKPEAVDGDLSVLRPALAE